MANEVTTAASAPLPAELAPLMPTGNFSPAMQIFMNPLMFERAKEIAKYLAKAEGFVPPHLVNKPEACFAVVTRAIVWRLDPYAVAQCTFSTPGGKVGFEGKLIQAILENSGKLAGRVRFTLIGDWSKIAGKFMIGTSQKGREYVKPTWTREEAAKLGLGVTVSAHVIGEDAPREETFHLANAFPLNSTLWATEPSLQIKYWSVRRFANTCAPGLLMGVPFADDDLPPMRDVTAFARPTRSEVEEELRIANTAPEAREAASTLPSAQQVAEEEDDGEPAPSEAAEREADRMMRQEQEGGDVDGRAEEEGEASDSPWGNGPEPELIEVKRAPKTGQPMNMDFRWACEEQLKLLATPAAVRRFVELHKATITNLPPTIGDAIWAAVKAADERVGG